MKNSIIKYTADTIIDGDGSYYKNATIIVNENGVIIDFLKNDVLSDSIYYKGSIIPGMINSHCHSELSYLKNKIKKHSGLNGFLNELMVHRNDTEINKVIECEAAVAEMKRNGIVAVGDICNESTSLNLFEKYNVDSHRFCEVYAIHPDNAEKAFFKGNELKSIFSEKGYSASLTFHAPYSLSEKLLNLILKAENKNQSFFTIHNQESEDENNFFLKGEGQLKNRLKSWGINLDFFKPPHKTSLQYLLSLINSDTKLMLVHNTYTSKLEIDWVEENYKNVYWCFCPKANLYIEKNLPNFNFWNTNSSMLLLGTDSLASNDSLNLIDEMRAIQNAYSFISFHEMVKWTCINAAKFFKLENKLGSFQKGKRPGIINVTYSDEKKLNINSNIKKIM